MSENGTQIQPAQASGFDPHAYTIVIRRATIDGQRLFHGRVMELPDLEAFEETYEAAYNFLIDGIEGAKEAFDEEGRTFPEPLPEQSIEFSGRVTLRMPTWLHARLDYAANAQQTSLNQYMVTLLSWAVVAAQQKSEPQEIETKVWQGTVRGQWHPVGGGQFRTTNLNRMMPAGRTRVALSGVDLINVVRSPEAHYQTIDEPNISEAVEVIDMGDGFVRVATTAKPRLGARLKTTGKRANR